jgi:hypothetical protein
VQPRDAGGKVYMGPRPVYQPIALDLGASALVDEIAMELPDDVYKSIKELCAAGDLATESSYSRALDLYLQAWDLVPAPKEQWEAATWILAAIGDANWFLYDFDAGRDNLTLAMKCPGGLGNPFIHLRLGQCQLELGNEERALDELLRAYMGAGAEVFAHEPPKYLEFLKERAQPPVGGW